VAVVAAGGVDGWKRWAGPVVAVTAVAAV